MIRKFTLALAATVLSASVAFAALSLDAAKTQGLVGEQPNGMIGAVDAGASPDVKALVDSTNAARLQRYQDIATKEGTPVEQVEAVAGEKLVNATPAGQYIKTAAGAWQKK
jgi:uncharacterized protein YdbL (DUF1318 family)